VFEPIKIQVMKIQICTMIYFLITLNLAQKCLIFVIILQTSITDFSYRKLIEKLFSFPGSN